jgi:hypothetical protein
MTAAIAISALGALVWAAERRLFQMIVHTNESTYLILAIASLVRAIPYAPLYIAFYLIANPNNPFTAATHDALPEESYPPEAAQP